MKICVKCHEVKPNEAYSRNGQGYPFHTCKACMIKIKQEAARQTQLRNDAKAWAYIDKDLTAIIAKYAHKVIN